MPLALVVVGFMGSAPVQATSRAEQLFKICASCHDVKAQGKSELQAPAIAGLPNWYIKAQLDKFAGNVRGNHHKDDPGMRMRAMARMLNDEERTQVADYVAAMPAVKTPVTINGDVEKGKELFVVCTACHGPNAEGNKDLNAPPLAGNDWYLETQLHNFKNGVRARDAAKDPVGATMVPMAQTLADDAAIRDVITYVQTIKK